MSLGKLSPTFLAVGLVGYWAWPFLSAADGEAQKETAVPQIAPAMLSPKIKPAPQRDPFRGPGEAEASKSPFGPGAASGRPKEQGPAAPKDAAAKSGVLAATPKGPAGAKDPAAWLSELALTATCTMEGRPMAMINGRLYAPGETLRLAGATGGPVTVAEIQAYRVVLELQGKKLDLAYANVDSGPRSSAPGKASPAGAASRGASRPAAGKSSAAAKPPKSSGGQAGNKSSR
jgi:hypothetical protein